MKYGEIHRKHGKLRPGCQLPRLPPAFAPARGSHRHQAGRCDRCAVPGIDQRPGAVKRRWKMGFIEILLAFNDGLMQSDRVLICFNDLNRVLNGG